jgi:tropinone reductase I
MGFPVHGIAADVAVDKDRKKLSEWISHHWGFLDINISSVAGSFDLFTGAPYGMAKAGLIQLTRHLAVEWAGYPIRVNTVSPWFTETPLVERTLADSKNSEAILAATPLRRVAQPAEVAAAVAFLAMDKASYITGHNLSVDGGRPAGSFK